MRKIARIAKAPVDKDRCERSFHSGPSQLTEQGSRATLTQAVPCRPASASGICLKHYFGATTRILEVGAGTGRLAVLLARWFDVEEAAACESGLVIDTLDLLVLRK